MKVILIDVSTLDGKLTKWNSNTNYEWSSPEDFAHFQKVKSQNNLLVMGSGTFNAVRNDKTAGLKPETERLRVILTSKPENYRKFAVPGQMEFSNETPGQLVHRLEKLGYKQMLLVAGSKVATSFFKERLIDELWLTVEPKIFGTGEPLVQEEMLYISLKLRTIKKLNPQGTLLLKYTIIT
jgi:dihydrofolate reductase